MKWILIITVVTGIVGLNFIFKPKQAVPMQKESKSLVGSYAPVAVLELFTSEGCSSCPPADNLLPQLVKLDSNVIPLSFHVDYWNHLGWKDPFSSNGYTERQRAYRKRFNLESLYTPQLIINGEYELVGSDRSKAEVTIKTVLKEKATVQLTVENVKLNNDKLTFTVKAEGDFKKDNLLAALVQRKVIMNVKAGENGGLKLSHTNVVRAFTEEVAVPKNEVELVFPKDLNSTPWELIIYTQQKNDFKITGAVMYHPNSL